MRHTTAETLSALLAPLPLRIAEPVEEETQGTRVVVEAQPFNGPQNIVGSDGLALLAVATVVRLARDHVDVLGNTLLNCFLGVIGDLGLQRQDSTHDSGDVGRRHIVVLVVGVLWGCI